MASENYAIKGGRPLPPTSVNQALNFDRDYSRLRNYYETWSVDYDNDVSEENYCGPRMLGDLFDSLLPASEARRPMRIMDACCGTGLVGKELMLRGFSPVDGCDLSPAMTNLARETQAYATLYGGVDLTEHNPMIADNQYDATFCCGAFIEGHLPTEAIHELMRITKNSGLILLSTRCTFYTAEHFDSLLHKLTASRQLSVLPSFMNAAYLNDVQAHYLAFAVNK